MGFLIALKDIVLALPALWRLVAEIRTGIETHKTNVKVKDVVDGLIEAHKTNDVEALNSGLNGD